MIQTSPLSSTSARTARDRVKILRYCLARLRAWRTEYELYANHQPQAPHEETNDISIPITSEEPSMTGLDQRTPPSLYSPASTSGLTLEEIAGPIDTTTVSLYQTTISEPRAKSRPQAAALSLEASDAPASTNEESAARRIRAFEQLPSLVAERPAALPTIDKLRVPRVVTQILSDVPEHWVQLAQALEARVREAGLGTLLVTSALKGEGASTVAMAVSVACARHTSLSVLLLEADFSNPSLATQFRLGARVGIEHHLLENVALADTIVTCQDPPLAILPALEAFELPSIVTGSLKMEEILQRLRKSYDLIIVDLGSVFAGRKPVTLPTGLDATLIVRDPAKSGPELLDQLDSYLARHHIASLGVIENGVAE